MFRFLLKVGALAGSLGIGYQYVDQSSMQSVLDSIGSWRQVVSGNVAGKADTGHEVARDKAEKSAPQTASGTDGLADEKRAFRGNAPADCYSERIIEPSDGSVRCED
jgi:hypothetical protein